MRKGGGGGGVSVLFRRVRHKGGGRGEKCAIVRFFYPIPRSVSRQNAPNAPMHPLDLWITSRCQVNNKPPNAQEGDAGRGRNRTGWERVWVRFVCRQTTHTIGCCAMSVAGLALSPLLLAQRVGGGSVPKDGPLCTQASCLRPCTGPAMARQMGMHLWSCPGREHGWSRTFMSVFWGSVFLYANVCVALDRGSRLDSSEPS